jgi:hypothetical protein
MMIQKRNKKQQATSNNAESTPSIKFGFDRNPRAVDPNRLYKQASKNKNPKSNKGTPSR